MARAADVHPDTIRRNPDLLHEVQHLREQQCNQPAATKHIHPNEAAQYNSMRARYLHAQAENTEQRNQLHASTESAHQALGTVGTIIDPHELEQTNHEVARLTVELQKTQAQLRHRDHRLEELEGEIDASADLNRDYVRQLNKIQVQLTRTKQEVTSIRGMCECPR